MTTMQPSGHPASEQQRQNELMQQIGEALLDAAPDGWRRIDLVVKMNVAVQDLALTVYLADGSTPEVVPAGDLTRAFAELRQLLHQPGRGTWFSARLSMNPPGSLNVSYNLDHDPKWFPPIPASYWVRDLEVFPRDEGFIPDWLREKIEEARHEEQNA